ncbi:MAG: hypothetical protein ACM3XM_02570 [Mycobacterium leprae]
MSYFGPSDRFPPAIGNSAEELARTYREYSICDLENLLAEIVHAAVATSGVHMGPAALPAESQAAYSLILEILAERGINRDDAVLRAWDPIKQQGH